MTLAIFFSKQICIIYMNVFYIFYIKKSFKSVIKVNSECIYS